MTHHRSVDKGIREGDERFIDDLGPTKINSEASSISGLQRSSASAPINGTGGSGGAAGSSLEADRVQLSNLSASLTLSSNGTGGDVTKLSSLNGAVLSGGYQVDAGAVSESIIRHSLQFGGANSF
jgi:anti-sigma28 factor (negative regulator of flagellin synthesis)